MNKKNYISFRCTFRNTLEEIIQLDFTRVEVRRCFYFTTHGFKKMFFSTSRVWFYFDLDHYSIKTTRQDLTGVGLI